MYEIAPIWGCLPAHVQQWLHCIWDVFMQTRDTYRRDVLGESGSCGSQIDARNNIDRDVWTHRLGGCILRLPTEKKKAIGLQ